MSEILNVLDVNNYGLQSMIASGGGSEVNLQSKDITINQNGTTTVTADTGYDGLSDVDVTVSGILDTSDATATAGDMSSGVTAYVNGQKITGNILTFTNTGNAGFTTSYSVQNSGDYVESTIKARSSDILLRANRGGVQTLIPKSSLAPVIGATAEKIKKDEVICGVTGTYEGLDTSDATATAGDMAEGRTAYVNGVKITGNIETVGAFSRRDYSADTNDIVMDNNHQNMILPKSMSAILFRPSSKVRIYTGYSTIATLAGLTADKLKKDEVVLGVTGTYEGSSGLDWSQIGYSGVPQEVTNGFNHAQSIMQNWTVKSDYSNEFGDDINLVFMPLVDTSSAINMSEMFIGCYSLITVPLLNTSNVTYMVKMFDGCRILTIPQLDTSNVTNMKGMFYDCESLTTIPVLNTSNVTDMSEMFKDCFSLTTVPQLNTSNVTDMSEMFWDCYSLITVPQLNTRNVTDMSEMFYDCSDLTNESLNNILAMCINAANYRGTRTLAELGLTSTQQATCQTLSNWNDFVEAGWSAS